MKSEFRFHYTSVATGNTFTPDQPYYTAPDGSLLLVERDEEWVKKKIGTDRKARNFFDSLRYSAGRRNYPNNSGVFQWKNFILPGFPDEAIISLNEGQTDPFEVPSWFAEEIGLKHLFIKMEGHAPSSSFKDRGMSTAVSDALRLQLTYPDLGIKGVSCASTGDTSAAAAIYSSYRADKLKCLVFLPYEGITESQLFQAMAHGAKVIAIDHPKGFDGCMQLVQEFSDKHPEYVLVNSKNAMRIPGQETIALEVLQDFEWNTPDCISVPVGNGGNLTALLLGLSRAHKFGLIDRLPRIIAGQAEVANTLFRWQESGFDDFSPGKQQKTIASAMNINAPVSFPRIKKLYQEFDIRFYSVAEQGIMDTWLHFMKAGASICPQTAVALNAVLQGRDAGFVKENDRIVAISTANGLKFADAGVKLHTEEKSIHSNPYKRADGTLQAIEAVL
jgi:threonine synthase